MSATITLPPELESLLAQKAAGAGVNVEQFALDVLRRAAERPSLNELLAEAHARVEANGRAGQELSPDAALAAPSKPALQVRRSTSGRVDLSQECEWVRRHRDEYRGR